MKLTEGFITRDIDGEQIMVSTGKVHFSGLLRSNKPAAFIINCLKTDTTLEQIVDAMYAKYNVPKDVLERDIASILDKLRSIGALDES
jgi:hypothetical protein